MYDIADRLGHVEYMKKVLRVLFSLVLWIFSKISEHIGIPILDTIRNAMGFLKWSMTQHFISLSNASTRFIDMVGSLFLLVNLIIQRCIRKLQPNPTSVSEGQESAPDEVLQISGDDRQPHSVSEDDQQVNPPPPVPKDNGQPVSATSLPTTEVNGQAFPVNTPPQVPGDGEPDSVRSILPISEVGNSTIDSQPSREVPIKTNSSLERKVRILFLLAWDLLNNGHSQVIETIKNLKPYSSIVCGVAISFDTLKNMVFTKEQICSSLSTTRFVDQVFDDVPSDVTEGFLASREIDFVITDDSVVLDSTLKQVDPQTTEIIKEIKRSQKKSVRTNLASDGVVQSPEHLPKEESLFQSTVPSSIVATQPTGDVIVQPLLVDAVQPLLVDAVQPLLVDAVNPDQNPFTWEGLLQHVPNLDPRLSEVIQIQAGHEGGVTDFYNHPNN